MHIIRYEKKSFKLDIAKENTTLLAISFSPFSEDYLTKLLARPHISIQGTPIDFLEEELDAYFSGKKPAFDIQMDLYGTEFQKKVWLSCAKIPYGETRSYADIANYIGNPKAVRAVGNALGTNPIPILIPCHRVIGKDRKLTGFAGGLDIKRKLLAIEQELK